MPFAKAENRKELKSPSGKQHWALIELHPKLEHSRQPSQIEASRQAMPTTAPSLCVPQGLSSTARCPNSTPKHFPESPSTDSGCALPAKSHHGCVGHGHTPRCPCSKLEWCCPRNLKRAIPVQWLVNAPNQYAPPKREYMPRCPCSKLEWSSQPNSTTTSLL